MRILTEANSDDVRLNKVRSDFTDNLEKLQQCYNNVKQAVKALQNVDFTATYGVNLPDILFLDKHSQTDILEGMISEPATQPEIEYLEELNRKLSNLL